MLRIVVLLITALISFPVFSQDLSDFRWKNRIVLIKAQDPESAEFLRQEAAFSRRSEALKERKILLVKISGSRYERIDYTREGFTESGELGLVPILDNRYPFEVILLGLDGGEKYRSTGVVAPDKLFALIDAMPMRAREIRNKKHQQE